MSTSIMISKIVCLNKDKNKLSTIQTYLSYMISFMDILFRLKLPEAAC